MFYFARMLEKIRLHARGELREDFHGNIGRGADGLCCNFLRVEHEGLKERTLAGGSNEEILEWCFANGRRLNDRDIVVWNGFVSKLGWKDRVSERLANLKKEGGLEGRTDIETMFQYFEVDEGRASR